MDNILPQLLSFPPQPAPLDPLSDIEYDKQIKAIVQTLSTISANKLTGGMRGGGDLLDVSQNIVNLKSHETDRSIFPDTQSFH